MGKVYFIFYKSCLEEVVETLREEGNVHLDDIKEEFTSLHPLASQKQKVMEYLERVNSLKSVLTFRGSYPGEKFLGPRHIHLKIG